MPSLVEISSTEGSNACTGLTKIDMYNTVYTQGQHALEASISQNGSCFGLTDLLDLDNGVLGNVGMLDHQMV